MEFVKKILNEDDPVRGGLPVTGGRLQNGEALTVGRQIKIAAVTTLGKLALRP